MLLPWPPGSKSRSTGLTDMVNVRSWPSDSKRRSTALMDACRVSPPVTCPQQLRLRADLREASRTLMDLGYTVHEPTVGTYFEWREQTIYAYVSIRETYARPSEQTCLEVYNRVVRHITAKAPGGVRSVAWYLESIFMHEGAGNYGRPRQMSEGLMNALKFEVNVLPANPMQDSRKVQCSGRMDAALDEVSVTSS